MAQGSGGRPRALAACAVLALALGGGALLWARPLPQPTPAARPVRSAGGTIFAKWCSDCHSTERGSGTMGLQRKYAGALPAVLEQRTDLSPELIRLVVRQGVSFMPSFRKTEISDAELAQLGAYLMPSQRTRAQARGAAANRPEGGNRP